ncbi:MAG: hypothetical protein KDE14_13315 [Rhodobacteraceae bacterium]|nr:hypothetical protein [Paracoccaceae bacterium]
MSQVPGLAATIAARHGLGCSAAVTMFDALTAVALTLVEDMAKASGARFDPSAVEFDIPDLKALAEMAGEPYAHEKWTAESANRLGLQTSPLAQLLKAANNGP